jgi:hypothetical protein
MRFRKGVHYEHPPRGRARKPYTVSEAARRQRCRNLRRTRIRSDRETAIIKRLIWQACFGPEPRPSQRALAQQFGVWWSYVAKMMGAAMSEGMRSSLQYGYVTVADLADAQRFTAKLRAQEPGLLALLPAHAQSNQEAFSRLRRATRARCPYLESLPSLWRTPKL